MREVTSILEYTNDEILTHLENLAMIRAKATLNEGTGFSGRAYYFTPETKTGIICQVVKNPYDPSWSIEWYRGIEHLGRTISRISAYRVLEAKRLAAVSLLITPDY